jgi:hypothetical protein
MEKPTKTLLIGLAASVLIFGAGYFVSSRAETKRAELVSRCESTAPLAAQTKGMFDDLIPSGKSVCSPTELDSIREQRNFADRSFLVSASTAFLIFALCVIPYSWYFTLRRVRELRDALLR